MAGLPLPRIWTPEELSDHRLMAIDLFVEWFKAKGNTAYQAHYAKAETTVTKLLDASNDLLDFGAATLEDRDKNLREAARYIAGPPLSGDDLRIIARVKRLWQKDRLPDLADVIIATRDPMRFPWLFDEPPRKPTEAEREVAIKWTAGLLASQKASTDRRNEPSKRQEKSVDDALAAAQVGFTKVKPRPITSVRNIEPGEYCRQSAVGGTRADLTIGLLDERLLCLECKVSNSEVNSYKRLNHEVGNKKRVWANTFGGSVVTGAVLAGAFSVDNLLKAQEAGISLFWEHDLSSLVEFVEAAKL